MPVLSTVKPDADKHYFQLFDFFLLVVIPIVFVSYFSISFLYID